MAHLDAYAVVALVAGEPAAHEVEEILNAGSSYVVLTNLAEAIFVVRRVYGWTLEQVRAVLDPMLLKGVLQTVSSSDVHAWEAADLRSRHYHRKTCAVSLADCFLLAHALAAEDVIVTPDRPLAAAARAEGVEVVGLPDVTGARP